MELDVTTMMMASLAVVIVMLLVYIAWRFREEKVSMSGLNIEELFKRIKDVEALLQKAREQPCWNCGEKGKEVAGNLFEDNEIMFTCKGCGTRTVWKRGKQWVIETGTTGYLEKLGKKVDVEKRKLKIEEK
jgi:hypothetical protein